MARAPAVLVAALVLAPVIGLAQTEDDAFVMPAFVQARAIPPDWQAAIAARRVSVSGAGLGDWNAPQATWRRAIVLSRGTDEDAQHLLVDGTRCASAMRTLRDHAPVRRIGATPYRISLSLGRIAHGTTTLRSIDGPICADVSPDDGTDPTLEVLSLVGPWLSFSEWSSENRAGGPPYHSESWSTIDLRTRSPVTITDVLDEASLLDALRRDAYLAREHPDALAQLATVSTWADAARVLEERTELRLGGFAFVSWDEARGLAGVRVGFHDGECGMCTNEVSALGLEVRPLDEAREHLRAAHAGRGHVLASGRVPAM